MGCGRPRRRHGSHRRALPACPAPSAGKTARRPVRGLDEPGRVHRCPPCHIVIAPGNPAGLRATSPPGTGEHGPVALLSGSPAAPPCRTHARDPATSPNFYSRHPCQTPSPTRGRSQAQAEGFHPAQISHPPDRRRARPATQAQAQAETRGKHACRRSTARGKSSCPRSPRATRPGRWIPHLPVRRGQRGEQRWRGWVRLV